MFRRVLVLGRIAAADVAARETQPQFYPSVSSGQALFAALGVGRNLPDVGKVGASLLGH
jgi:hypothetical protein